MNIKMRFRNGLLKAVTLSYDDGPMSDEKCIDIMAKNGLKGTFNINSSKFFSEDKTIKAEAEHLKDIYKSSGNEVACHGVWHLKLTEMNRADKVKEVLEDRIHLETEFNTIVRGMAYAYGLYNDETVDVLKESGICYSRTVEDSNSFELPSDWFRLNPICHHNNKDLPALIEAFLAEEDSGCNEPMLFYLWGHTFEFDRHNNWNVLEDFARKIGNRNDVWYATNIEIYDYVKGFNNLCFSYDNTIVYNPNAFDIWFTADGELVKVSAGETIKLQ